MKSVVALRWSAFKFWRASSNIIFINADKVGEILVVGTDGDKEAVQSVADGQLSATVAQDPAQIGAISLELLVEAVEAGNKGEVGVFPETTPVESVLIDSTNAAEYLAE